MSSLEPLLHPYAILDFLARERIPELAKIPLVERYYKAILDDPDAAIQTCRTLMSSRVVDMFEAGTLWDANAYVLPPDLCEQKRNGSLAVDIPSEGFEYTTCLQFCYSRKQPRVSAENIPKVPGAYIFVIMLADGHRIYGGQSKNLLYRTIHCHLSANIANAIDH
jgi:hypothetical protein